MPKNWIDNTHWIIRAAGERTKDVCSEIIREFVPADSQEIIEERPFAEAIRKTFERGYLSGKKWTVCIDADVFVSQEGFRQLHAIAETLPPRVWYVQGLTIDKFIPIIRTAGTGIYRNKYVREALKYIPGDGTSLRPETTTMQGMLADRYLMYRTPIVVGLHDLEQSYIDIGRKTFLHFHKHHKIRDEMIAYWERRQRQDLDFKAALMGARLGEKFDGALLIDREFKRQEIQAALSQMGLKEKLPLQRGGVHRKVSTKNDRRICD